MKFLIVGTPVSKKNSQQILINPKTRRPFISPSAKYKRYAKNAVEQLLMQAVAQGLNDSIDFPVNIKMRFYMDTHRRCDLVNLEEAALDVLCEAGIIRDDNYTIAESYDESLVLYDKEFPRTEITITRKDGGLL